ncbi:hypothetical protein LTR28_012892 [Elasticomyces elasticus]|nr:hypothetical protein LTR28_012892 [Elasticomyces elasticus]
MDQRRNDITSATPGTCLWILKEKEYLAWMRERKGLLWIKGNPGVGKSTLLKYILRNNEPKRTSRRRVEASFFFTGRGSDLQKSRLGLFRSLLHQLLKQTPSLLCRLAAVFKTKRDQKGEWKKDWDWHENELREFLADYILQASETSSVQIYVDALDEAGETVARDLLDYFNSLTTKSGDRDRNMKICLSSRHYPLNALVLGRPIYVQRQNDADIATYAEEKLKSQITDAEELRVLKEEVRNGASGIFLWAILVIPVILSLHKYTELGTIRRKIGELPSDLDSLYTNILNEIQDDEERSRSLRLVEWICFARRPLDMGELRYAVAVGSDASPASLQEWRMSDKYVATDSKMEQATVHLSCGLVEILQQNERRVAQFIHQSVNDYLIQGGGLQRLRGSSMTIAVGSIEHRLSRTCIRYLAMEEVMKHCGSDKIDRNAGSEFPLLDYATRYWTSHAEKVEESGMSQGDLLELLRWPSNRILACWITTYRDFGFWGYERVAHNMTLLHIGARHGFLSVIEAIINQRTSIGLDERDEEDQTPLLWALWKGHEAVVKLLLDTGKAEADSKDQRGRTPLWRAAEEGHEAVVKLLLDTDKVEADSKDEDSSTPL